VLGEFALRARSARASRSRCMVEQRLNSACCCGLPLTGLLPSCSPELANPPLSGTAQTRFYVILVPWLLYGCLTGTINAWWLVASRLIGVFVSHSFVRGCRPALIHSSSHIPRVLWLQMQATPRTPYVYMCALWGAGSLYRSISLRSSLRSTAPAPRRTSFVPHSHNFPAQLSHRELKIRVLERNIFLNETQNRDGFDV